MRPFTYSRMVQFAETDVAGVMHFSNYFRLMEEAEHAYWRSIGLSVHEVGDDPKFSWPRVAVECEYRKPAHFEDQLELRVGIREIGGKSMEFEVEFWRGDDRLATGRMTVVCCALMPEGFRPIEIPQWVRAKLSARGV